MESLRKKEDIFKLIDKTFEIQFRTVLSEGWHEVDHLLRYKCADDWNGLFNESRMLNGIYASLETSDRTLKALFEDIAYSHYKTSNWEAMLRNKFLLNFSHDRLDSSLLSLLNSDNEFGRHIIKMNRTQVIKGFVNSPVTFPLSLTNWTHYLNHKYIKNEEFSALTSKRLLEQFNE